jgi:hypothetical protein
MADAQRLAVRSGLGHGGQPEQHFGLLAGLIRIARIRLRFAYFGADDKKPDLVSRAICCAPSMGAILEVEVLP